MKSIYLSTENFHIATEQERKKMRKSQCHNFILCWFKRFFITFILAGVAIAFQILARETIPYSFKPYQTKERMIVLVVCIFAVFNVLSLIQLLIHNYIAFNINRAFITSAVVKKKMTVDEIIPYLNQRRKYKYLVCELEDGTFILDRIWVHGPINYSNIKVGNTVYIELKPDNSRHHYVI